MTRKGDRIKNKPVIIVAIVVVSAMIFLILADPPTGNDKEDVDGSFPELSDTELMFALMKINENHLSSDGRITIDFEFINSRNDTIKAAALVFYPTEVGYAVIWTNTETGPGQILKFGGSLNNREYDWSSDAVDSLRYHLLDLNINANVDKIGLPILNDDVTNMVAPDYESQEVAKHISMIGNGISILYLATGDDVHGKTSARTGDTLDVEIIIQTKSGHVYSDLFPVVVGNNTAVPR